MCVCVCACVCICVCVYTLHYHTCTVQDYEETLEEYCKSLEDQFTRMASITYAQNTKRPTSSAAELGRNVLAQDVLKLRQRYDKLLSALEKK